MSGRVDGVCVAALVLAVRVSLSMRARNRAQRDHREAAARAARASQQPVEIARRAMGPSAEGRWLRLCAASIVMPNGVDFRWEFVERTTSRPGRADGVECIALARGRGVRSVVYYNTHYTRTPIPKVAVVVTSSTCILFLVIIHS